MTLDPFLADAGCRRFVLVSPRPPRERPRGACPLLQGPTKARPPVASAGTAPTAEPASQIPTLRRAAAATPDRSHTQRRLRARGSRAAERRRRSLLCCSGASATGASPAPCGRSHAGAAGGCLLLGVVVGGLLLRGRIREGARATRVAGVGRGLGVFLDRGLPAPLGDFELLAGALERSSGATRCLLNDGSSDTSISASGWPPRAMKPRRSERLIIHRRGREYLY